MKKTGKSVLICILAAFMLTAIVSGTAFAAEMGAEEQYDGTLDSTNPAEAAVLAENELSGTEEYVTNEVEDNDTVDTANRIAPNSVCSGTFKDYNDVDYYKLTLPEKGKLELRMKQREEPGKSYIYWTKIMLYKMEEDGNMTSLGSWENVLVENTILPQLRLPAGDYVIKVKVEPLNLIFYKDSTFYQIENEYTIEDDRYEDENNDEQERAGILPVNMEQTGNLSSEEDVDWFHAAVTENSKLQVQVAVSSSRGEAYKEGLFNVFIYRVHNGTRVLYGSFYTRADRNTYSREIQAPAGEYYICVKAGSGYQRQRAGGYTESYWDYALQIKQLQTGLAIYDNDLPEGFNVPVIAHDCTIGVELGADKCDFAFYLPEKGIVSFGGDKAIISVLDQDGNEEILSYKKREVLLEKGSYKVNFLIVSNYDYAKSTGEIHFTPIQDIKNAYVSNIPAVTYNGLAHTPNVNVQCNGYWLKRGTDFEVMYTNNVRAGTASVIISGIGLYKGRVTKTFQIEKAEKAIYGKSAWTKMVGEKKFTLGIEAADGAGITYTSSNPKVARVDRRGKVTIKKAGKTVITATAGETANFKSVSKSVTVTVIKKLKGSKITRLKRGGQNDTSLYVKWKKVKGVSGYEIRYAKSRSMQGSVKKKVSAKKNAVTFRYLNPFGTYYVQIRTYKKVNGGKCYSKWSKAYRDY